MRSSRTQKCGLRGPAPNRRWSISNAVTYNGGTVETPFDDRIPNISAGTGNTNFANMTDSIFGQISCRHAKSSMLAGIGARWISPLNGANVPDHYNGNKFDAYNPYLKYQYVYRWSRIQSALSTGATWTTFDNLTRAGVTSATGSSSRTMSTKSVTLA